MSPPIDFVGQSAQDKIFERLKSFSPCMISRFGSVELQAITRCLAHREKSFLKRIKNYLNASQDFFYYEKHIFSELENNAGFFPSNEQTIEKFSELYLSIIKDIDILGSWLTSENYIKFFFSSDIVRIPLGHLEPYGFENPWSRILEGKKVLVVHPFEKSIQAQYKNRERLFDNPSVLPRFELTTIKAVQSIAGTKTNFDSWFSALEYMKNKIASTNFDIAIIGAGAYGMPLASFVKQIGKKAVHLGGATQILFGIRGKRWDSMDSFQKFFNENWIYPISEERPTQYENVENGCYW